MPVIPDTESLTVEFKSDQRCLPDRELIEAIVCLANTEGGELFLGVEDDGVVTGLHRRHSDTSSLGALIANRTVPSLVCDVERLGVGAHFVARIRVPKARQITATSDGVLRRRRLQLDGTPECIPFLPHEFPQRLSDLALTDPSNQPVPGASLADLDPAERARLRQFVERFNGDRALLDLTDAELDGALGLTTRAETSYVPTLTGLLLIGRETALQRLVPTHEVAFQVLDGEDVRFNEFRRAPLLRTFEWLEAAFGPLNAEQEIQAGLFRVPIPLVDRRAFREAVANALTHRDYTRLGAVHVRLERDALVVSNPGGFVEGVTLDNLLTTEPRPRNPRLADAFKRIGLVERTGRGVDLIYRGLLRYGRPRPDYSRSTSQSVVLRLPTVDADVDFLKLVLDEEGRTERPLPIDSLVALASLREHRRLSRSELATAMQRNDTVALATLEGLVERGLAEAHGRGRGRSYTLAASVYARQGRKVEYTRQAGFDRLQQEQMVLGFVRQHGEIRRGDVMELCRLSGDQASRLLRRMADEGTLVAHGDRRWRHYTAADA
ncbi:MAG: putative DNA binding domain-containing protein [Alphaproteobacteria bacterium]|nr:putative DNA binding domain-containing protein [Alphaproteobacteria bacterium]